MGPLLTGRGSRRALAFAGLAGIVAFSASLSRTQVIASTTRDPFLSPFTPGSIWNQPIGSGAIYAPANIIAPTIKAVTADATVQLMSPTQPLTNVMQNGGQQSNRCTATSSTPIASLPIDPTIVIPSTTSNEGYAAIGSDAQTLTEGGSFARCVAGGGATASKAKTYGSIYGDGIPGGAGGSGLSTLGGTLHVGELAPGSTINHSLRINIAGVNLYKGTSTTCWRWPATKCDGYGPSSYGGTNPQLAMGALLALPASLDLTSLNLSPAALIVATALRNHGAYIANDAVRSTVAITTENEGTAATSATAQFQAVWGFPFVTAGATGSGWTDDMQKIYAHLAIVTNNSPTTIGGGGTPLVPLSAPLSATSPSPTPTATATPSPTLTATPTPAPTPTPTPTPVPTDS